MRSTITCYLFLATVARLVHAQSYCDASTGYPISDQTSDSGTDSGYTPDSDCDADCQLYYSQQQSLYSDYFNDATIAGGNSFLSAAGGKRDLEHTSSVLPRQDDLYLTCTAAQTCFEYENIPLCIDTDTGDFVDPSGGYGNILSGTYIAATDSGSTTTNADPNTNTNSNETTSSSGSSSSGSSSSSSGSSSGSGSGSGSSSNNTSSTSSSNGASWTHAGGMSSVAVVLSATLALLAI